MLFQQGKTGQFTFVPLKYIVTRWISRGINDRRLFDSIWRTCWLAHECRGTRAAWRCFALHLCSRSALNRSVFRTYPCENALFVIVDDVLYWLTDLSSLLYKRSLILPVVCCYGDVMKYFAVWLSVAALAVSACLWVVSHVRVWRNAWKNPYKWRSWCCTVQCGGWVMYTVANSAEFVWYLIGCLYCTLQKLECWKDEDRTLHLFFWLSINT